MKNKFLSLLTLIPICGILPQTTACNIVSKTCLIKFVAQEGGIITGNSTQEVIKGTKWKDVINLPTVTPNTNYTFDGWYNSDTLMTESSVINENITITAKFTENQKVTISFATSTGGTITGSTSAQVYINTKWKDVTNRPTVMPDTNYTFDGWYDGTTKIENADVITNSKTVTAKFSPIIVSKTVNKFFVLDSIDIFREVPSKSLQERFRNAFVIKEFNNQSIGYLNINKSMNYYSGSFTVSTIDNKTTISTTHESNPTTCVFDHVLQTITFADYERFNDFSKYGPMMNGCNGGENYFHSVEQKEYVSKSLTIDLNDYHLKTYCYNGEGYMPFEFYKNLFNLYFGLYFMAKSYTKWDYTGDGLYQIVEGTSSNSIPYKKRIKEVAIKNNFYNACHMEYLYNLLAFTLDLRWGLPQRQSRSNPGETKYFLRGDIYKILKPYHDKYVSMEDNTSCDTMRQIFRELLDDGGHASDFILNSYVSKEPEYIVGNYYGPESKYTEDINSGLKKARNSSKNDVISHWISQGKDEQQAKSMIGYYKEYKTETKNPIAYITFDNFISRNTFYDDYEKDKKRELPSSTIAANYGIDTLRLTMYANKMIKENNIKNVVIDLSLNGGGAVYVEHFIASWLCGGVVQKMYNPKNNQYCEYIVKADIDGDGDFDKDDYLDPSVKLFIITSSSSFSCANLLACNVQDNRPTNSYFIGHRSGGGACFVDSDINLGRNSCCRLSSLNHILRKSSSPTNFITVDDGCDITTNWEIDEINKPEDFYNRDNINNKIWNIL